MSEGNRIVAHHGAAGVMVHFEAAKRALAEARSIDEVKQVRDQAEALRLYVKQQGECLQMANDICEIKLRAERKAGEMLAAMPKHNGDPRLHDATRLQDLGIEKTQSHRWQLEAKVSEEDFERLVEETNAQGEELTSRSLLDLAKKQAGTKKKSKLPWLELLGRVKNLDKRLWELNTELREVLDLLAQDADIPGYNMFYLLAIRETSDLLYQLWHREQSVCDGKSHLGSPKAPLVDAAGVLGIAWPCTKEELDLAYNEKVKDPHPDELEKAVAAREMLQHVLDWEPMAAEDPVEEFKLAWLAMSQEMLSRPIEERRKYVADWEAEAEAQERAEDRQNLTEIGHMMRLDWLTDEESARSKQWFENRFRHTVGEVQ
jgi:hypothetical protein